jgi:ribA/ribD-fused uncharacterized protein
MQTENYVIVDGTHGTLTCACMHILYPVVFKEKTKESTIYYSCIQHYVLAHKALLINDHKLYEEIIYDSNPDLEYYLNIGLNHTFTPEEWEQNEFKLLVKGNVMKFAQNPDLGILLKNTKNKIIGDASFSDGIWNTGLSARSSCITPAYLWPGKNLAGKALMVVRERLTHRTPTMLDISPYS